jgi:polar amino acid transport system substrate-binding protein
MNKRISFKALMLASVAAAGLLAITSAQAQTALDDVMKAKKITIAIPTDFPPYGFVGTDLKPQGLDIDMANYIAQKMGVGIELVAVTSANRIPYLQTKKADLVISTLGKNPDREKVIDFTAAYSPFFQAVFAAKSLNVKSSRKLRQPRQTSNALKTTTPPSLPSSLAKCRRLLPAHPWRAT